MSRLLRRHVGLTSVRPLLGVVALAATLILAGHLVLGRLDGPARISAAEAQNLSAPPGPTIHQGASARCFGAMPAVAGVRSTGRDLRVRFTDQRSAMRIQYMTSSRAATRYAYAHGTPNNVYANTNWFDIPGHLTHGDTTALSRCLPLPRTP